MKHDVLDLLEKAANATASRLPTGASEERLHRHRMPTTALARSLRNGAPIRDVAEAAALRVVERWARILKAKDVSLEQLPPTIAQLVHGSTASDNTLDLPDEPLRGALHRVVPRLEVGVLPNKWVFLEELIELFNVEQKFDRSSISHTPPAGPRMKLALACGGAPPVWTKSAPAGTFARISYEELRNMRIPAGEGAQAPAAWKVKGPTVPGPGAYGLRDVPWMMSHPRLQLSPRRAEFPSVGRPRAKCLVSCLSVGERVLGPM